VHWAAINGHKDTAEFLVSHGADLTIRDAKFDFNTGRVGN